MSDLFYGGNDTIYHLSTGTAAMAGSMLTPYVNGVYGKAGVTAAGSTVENGRTAGTTAAEGTAGNAQTAGRTVTESGASKPAVIKPTAAEAAGGTADDALEQFYDDIFESSYGEQFDPVKEQAIAGTGDIAETMESAASGSNIFKPPSITTNSRGELTNGLYTLNQNDMLIHVNGKNPNKSQFLYNVDANKAVLDAAAYADEFNLWEASSGNMADFANKAKIPVTNGYVGITGNGELTTYINVYRTKTGYVHGCPGNP